MDNDITKLRSVCGVRVVYVKGYYMLVDPTNKKATYIMDQKFKRISHNKWIAEPAPNSHVSILREAINNKPIYIVGLGATLDNVKEEHIEDGCCIFCVNESHKHFENFKYFENVYGVHVDYVYNGLFIPKSRKILTPYEITVFHHNVIPFYTTHRRRGGTLIYLVDTCIKLFTPSEYRFIGVDFYFLNSWEYSKVKIVKPTSQHAISVLKRQTNSIKQLVKNINCYWFDGKEFIRYVDTSSGCPN